MNLFSIWEKFLPKRFRIPRGVYCYRGDKLCPFWSKDYNQPEQENGYCSYLGRGDWENEGFGLLWDQVKECGVNNWEWWMVREDVNGFLCRAHERFLQFWYKFFMGFPRSGNDD